MLSQLCTIIPRRFSKSPTPKSRISSWTTDVSILLYRHESFLTVCPECCCLWLSSFGHCSKAQLQRPEISNVTNCLCSWIHLHWYVKVWIAHYLAGILWPTRFLFLISFPKADHPLESMLGNKFTDGIVVNNLPSVCVGWSTWFKLFITWCGLCCVNIVFQYKQRMVVKGVWTMFMECLK